MSYGDISDREEVILEVSQNWRLAESPAIQPQDFGNLLHKGNSNGCSRSPIQLSRLHWSTNHMSAVPEIRVASSPCRLVSNDGLCVRNYASVVAPPYDVEYLKPF